MLFVYVIPLLNNISDIDDTQNTPLMIPTTEIYTIFPLCLL